MKRTILHRLPALWLAIVFLLSAAGESVGIGACPHHGAHSLPVGGAAASAEHQHSGEHGDAASADAALAGTTDHDTGSSDAAHATPCTCLGVCPSGTPGTAVACEHAAAPPAVGTLSQAGLTEREDDAILVATPYAIPFAQAPPPSR